MRSRTTALTLAVAILMLPMPTSGAASKVITKVGSVKAVKILTSLVSQRQTLLMGLQKKESSIYSQSNAKYSQDLATLDAAYLIKITAAKTALASLYDALDVASVFISQATNVITCGTHTLDSQGIISFSRACAVGEHFIYPYPRMDGVGMNNYIVLTKVGALVPVDNAQFQSALAAVNDAKTNIDKIDNQHAIDSQSLRTNSTAVANATESATQAAIVVADAILTDTKGTLIAAKRASLSKANFESAFSTAYKFAYNYEIMLQIANSPFDTINSIYSLVAVQIAVKKAYDAGGIDIHYTESQARDFNQSIGNAFIGSDTDFLKKFTKALNLYRSSAK